jgi:trimethylamine corrinoid protein
MTLEDSIKERILEWDEDGLIEICKSSIEKNEATPTELLKIIGNVMEYVGEMFEREEFFVPELIVASNTVKAAIDQVLDPAIKKGGGERETKGKIVLGTVEGDVHSIGKDLVASFLFSNGFEVYNLGVEVPATKFIEKAEEIGAKVIGLSSLLTMSMDFQRQVINELKSRNLRDKYFVIIGGAPTSEEWADEIGADGWADDAMEAISLLNKLLS